MACRVYVCMRCRLSLARDSTVLHTQTTLSHLHANRHRRQCTWMNFYMLHIVLNIWVSFIDSIDMYSFQQIYNNAFTKVVESCIIYIHRYLYIWLHESREMCERSGLGSSLVWRCRNIRWKLSLHNILFKKLHFPSTRVAKEKFEEIVCFPHSNI